MTKRINIPCQFSSEVVVNANLVPVKITALHSNENRNNTNISIDTIKSAVNTLYNKPILAYITENDDGEYDFRGHEIEIDWDDNGELKRKFYEYPVGIIPESSEIDFYEMDGKTYLTCTGYIYKEYSNETIDIINKTNGKCVSVEIAINDGTTLDNGVYNITDFSFLGITILSDEVTPGMDENCRIEFIRTPENYADFLNKAINDVAKFENEKNNHDKEQESTEVETKKDEEYEVENAPEVVKESDNEDTEQSEVEEAVDTPQIENKSEVPESEETDINYSIFNDLFENEIDSLTELKILFVDLITKLQDEIFQKDNIIIELEKQIAIYKQSERETQISEILEEIGYTFKEEEIKESVKKAKNFEITILEFKKELFAIIGEKNLKSSKKVEMSTYNNDGIILVGQKTGNKDKQLLPYADLFDGII